jgi:tryptophan synthase alpha chain
MDNIFLVAPTTPEERTARIAERASGFIYYVALKGVTGAGHLDTNEVMKRVAQIRQHSTLPVAVGFGIKNAESARSIATAADGVVVGSALVSAMAQANGPGAVLEAAASMISDIRKGVDSAAS